MSSPKISIIIPVYNVEDYLSMCIESVIAQTYKDWELILVDDGSPDNSGSICDEYASRDPRIRVIHKKNAGVSAARNTGIEAANGEWISFIDSDDWVDTDYLEKFELDKDDADLIIQGLEYYDNRNGQYFKQIKVADCILSGADSKKLVADNNVLGSGYPVAKAYRKFIIDKGVLFDTSISYHEDHIFVLNILAVASKIRLSDSVAYKYRYFHTNSSLSSKRHPWQNLNIASEGMIDAISRIHDKFVDTGSSYERKIYNFAYAPKIAAVFEVFKTECNDVVKHNAIRTIINKDQLSTYYSPYSRKDKMVKSVLYYAPYFIMKLFFSIYIKYQNRNAWI